MQEILGLRLENFDEIELQRQIQKKIQAQKQKCIAIRYLTAEEVLARRQQSTSLKMFFQTRQNTLKQKGQYLEATGRINAWIFKNIDRLYKIERQRRLQMNPGRYAGLTSEQEAKEMLKFRRFLADSAEQMVLRHRTALQTRKHDSLKNHVTAARRYELKNQHLDAMIEEDILYFNAKANDATSMRFASIRAAYRMKQKKLRLLSQMHRRRHHHHHPCKGHESNHSKAEESDAHSAHTGGEPVASPLSALCHQGSGTERLAAPR